MQRYKTKAIILRRVNYGEADRIVTFLTPKYGRIAGIVKGARREKSKLAGGIELFSESEITLLKGKGGLDIVTSTRLIKYYRHIISDYERMTVGYMTVALANKLTEDGAGGEFYDLLRDAFMALNDADIPAVITELWYRLNIMQIHGTGPNLRTDSRGKKLSAEERYAFDVRDGAFTASEQGNITADHIKTWRLLLANPPARAAKVKGILETVQETNALVTRMQEFNT